MRVAWIVLLSALLACSVVSGQGTTPSANAIIVSQRNATNTANKPPLYFPDPAANRLLYWNNTTKFYAPATETAPILFSSGVLSFSLDALIEDPNPGANDYFYFRNILGQSRKAKMSDVFGIPFFSWFITRPEIDSIDIGADKILVFDDSVNGFRLAAPSIGGGGDVDSVNGQTGVVVLDTGDIDPSTNRNYVTDAQQTTLSSLSPLTGTPDGTKFLRDDKSWQPIPGGGDALTTSPLSQFAPTTSAQLRGVLTDESGTGVFLTTNGSAADLTDFPTLNQNTTGNAATATTASAGDSATGFFPSGTIEHERGGLEADVSAYAGLLGITSGATVEVNTIAELNTAMGSAASNADTLVQFNDSGSFGGIPGVTYVKGTGALAIAPTSLQLSELIGLGGATSSFPALKRNAAQLDVRLADDSNYANMRAAAIQATALSAGSLAPSSSVTLTLQSRSFSVAGNAVEAITGTHNHSSGQFNGLAILPTYNQTDTAAATDLLINRIQTAVGSGAQFLIDAQVGGSSLFSVSNTGVITAAGFTATEGSVIDLELTTIFLPEGTIPEALTLAGNDVQNGGQAMASNDPRSYAQPTPVNRYDAPLEADEVLTTSSPRFQYRTPDADDWKIGLPADGDAFYLFNESDTFSMNIAVSDVVVVTIGPNSSATARHRTGIGWRFIVSFPTDQDLLTTSAVTFATFTTGTAAIAASAIDWAAATSHYKTLGANTTFTFANAANGRQINVAITGASTFTVEWPAGVLWSGGVDPVQTVDATDVYTFVQINSVIYGSVVQDFQ